MFCHRGTVCPSACWDTHPPLPWADSKEKQTPPRQKPLSGHRHATISLICMITHKAMAARCLSYHQAAYGQPAIRALATAP